MDHGLGIRDQLWNEIVQIRPEDTMKVEPFERY